MDELEELNGKVYRLRSDVDMLTADAKLLQSEVVVLLTMLKDARITNEHLQERIDNLHRLFGIDQIMHRLNRDTAPDVG